MEWPHPVLNPSGLIRSLALTTYPALLLERTLRHVGTPGPLCVLHDVVLATHPARLHRAPGPRNTGFDFVGGRAWRMALLPRAYELLTLCSPEEPETAALAVIGLILGGLAPGGDLLGPPPTRQTVARRLAALYAQWHDEWTRFGLTSAEFARIRQISTQCAAPQVDVPNPARGTTAVLGKAAYAVDRPGTVGTECDGVVHLPTWADPDLAPEIARVHLERAVSSHKPPVLHRLSVRTMAFASTV